MRRGFQRFRNNEDKDVKKILYTTLVVLIIAFIAFIITFVTYSNVLSENNSKTSKARESVLDSSQASSSIGKRVNEIKSEGVDFKNDLDGQNKIAINTSDVQKEQVQSNGKDEKEQINENKNTEVKKEENKTKELVFTKPVEGDIIKEYAKEKLVYSQTLQEWVTHTGIDIKANKTTIVKASEAGKVVSIKNDPRYGLTVIIEHSNGFKTIYSNLLTAEFVKEGEDVIKEQTIGTVGNTAAFEISDESHLHFEMLKDNEYVDPCLYLK